MIIKISKKIIFYGSILRHLSKVDKQGPTKQKEKLEE